MTSETAPPLTVVPADTFDVEPPYDREAGDLPEDRFLDRELSWLHFNTRVLELAEDPRQPLLERVRFLAIFASNLDEFYMVRIAGLKRRHDMGLTVRSPDGLTIREQIQLVTRRTQDLVQRHAGVHPVGATGQGLGHRVLDVELVDDLAQELLDEVLERDEPGDAAVLVDDDGHVDVARLELAEQARDGQELGDEEDVALSVLRCLYEGAARGQFAAVVNRRELWQLLATITIRKVINQQRLLKKQKRGGGRVRGDSVLKVSDGDGWGAGFDEILGDAATPEVLAIAVEEYQRLMCVLDDDRLRAIAQCKLEGHRNEEIADRLSLACRSIERKLQRIRQVWEAELGQ